MRRATVEQTKSAINAADYIVCEAGASVYEITSNYLSKEIMTPLRMSGEGRDYAFRRNILQGAVSIKQYDVMDLYEGEEKQGYICGNAVYFSGSMTYTIEWAGRQFTMYDVGLGSAGIKLPIFDGDRQVALVEKDGTVQDMLDRYEVYTIEDTLFPMTVLAALYYDRENFSDRGKQAQASVRSTTTFSLSDKQLARYDEAWVKPFLTPEEIIARTTEPVAPLPKPLRIFLKLMPLLLGAITLLLFYFMVYK